MGDIWVRIAILFILFTAVVLIPLCLNSRDDDD